MKRSWWLQLYKSISLKSSKKNRPEREANIYCALCAKFLMYTISFSPSCELQSIIAPKLLIRELAQDSHSGGSDKWSDSGYILKVQSKDLLTDWMWVWKRGLKDDTSVVGLKTYWDSVVIYWNGGAVRRTDLGERSEIQFWSVKLEMSIRLLKEMLSMQLDLSLAGGDQIWTLSADRQYWKT